MNAENQIISSEIAAISPQEMICQFVEQHTARLLGTLCGYLKRAGFVRINDLQDATKELLNDVLVEALQHAERFDTLRSPMAWLLGIAANLIRRRKDASIKRWQREILFSETDKTATNEASEEKIWVVMARLAFENSMREVEGEYEAQKILSLVSETDRRILHSCIIEQMDYQDAAREFNCTTGAMRVRLYRAINRLRDALITEKNREGGERNV